MAEDSPLYLLRLPVLIPILRRASCRVRARAQAPGSESWSLETRCSSQRRPDNFTRGWNMRQIYGRITLFHTTKEERAKVHIILTPGLGWRSMGYAF